MAVDTDPIIRQFGTWAVTEYGVECLTEPYPIEKACVHEPDWLDHMKGKPGYAYWDFYCALKYAQHFFGRQPPVRSAHSLRNRFDILKRDGYRCRLCGATADDGARLEVDHKIPRTNNGNDSADNLWTLCFSCNRGKFTRPL